MCKVCGLADKAVVDYGSVLYLGACGEYKAFGYDIAAYGNRITLRRCDCSVVETHCSVDCGIIADINIGYLTGVDNIGLDAYAATTAIECTGMNLNHGHKALYHIAAVAVHGDKVGTLCRHGFIDWNLATTGLVEHRHLGTDTECALECTLEAVYIFNHSIVGNIVVGDIVRYTVDIHVLTHAHIVQGHVTDTALALDTAGQIKTAGRNIELYLTRKYYIANTHRIEALGYGYTGPVAATSVLFKNLNLFFCQTAKRHKAYFLKVG